MTYRPSADIAELYREHGEMLAREGWGANRAATALDLPYSQARRLVHYIKRHGPPENGPETSGGRRGPRGKGRGKKPAEGRIDPLTVVCIGDAHFAPGQDLSRARVAGQLCREVGADVVVQMGDWADMGSLSSFDRGKRAAENRRFELDCAVANDAIGMFHQGLGAHECRRIALLGNHEYRIDRYVEDQPALEGTLDSDVAFEWTDRGWEVVPYGEMVEVGGVQFAHHFGRSRSSATYLGAGLLRKGHTSCVEGHRHRLDWAHRTTYGGRRIHGLCVGCYFDHHEGYAGMDNADWWRGLVVLRNVRDGDLDLESWSMRRLLG